MMIKATSDKYKLDYILTRQFLDRQNIIHILTLSLITFILDCKGNNFAAVLIFFSQKEDPHLSETKKSSKSNILSIKYKKKNCTHENIFASPDSSLLDF